MQADYVGSVSRLLRPDERNISTREERTPLVIEPATPLAAGLQSLRDLLARHSSAIMRDLATHGAILLRGFRITTPNDFEDAVLSIRGLDAIKHVFMSEGGRTIMRGTRFVLHTNTMYKTGGGLNFSGFHVECYYVPDVPRFICFSCLVPSWLGGETGLVNVAGVYDDLPAGLREELEGRAFWVSAWPVSEIAERYQVSPEAVEELCSSAGLPSKVHEGQKVFLMYKPSILQHPLTRERALAINMGGELEYYGLRAALQDAFLPDYMGGRWAMHRFVWRFPRLRVLSLVPSLFRAPSYAVRTAYRMLIKPLQRTMDVRVSSAFTKDEITALARAMRKRFSSFRWAPGDILLVDNLKMAHAGMPGLGPRQLAALIGNPISVPLSATAPGVHCVVDESHETLGARLTRQAGSRPVEREPSGERAST